MDLTMEGGTMDLTRRIGLPSPPHEILRMYIDSLELFPEESPSPSSLANHPFLDDVISSDRLGRFSEAPLPFPVSSSLSNFLRDRFCPDPPVEESRSVPVNFYVDNIYVLNYQAQDKAEAPEQQPLSRNVDVAYDVTPGLESSGVNANFECNVCWEMAKDPVVTLCGHLFCWDCVDRSFHLSFRGRNCPVCEEDDDVSTLVPIYARGSSSNWKQERDGDQARLVI